MAPTTARPEQSSAAGSSQVVPRNGQSTGASRNAMPYWWVEYSGAPGGGSARPVGPGTGRQDAVGVLLPRKPLIGVETTLKA